MNRLSTARAAGLFLSLGLLFAAAAEAHEVRPAYLRIQQTAADQFDLLWRVPARGDMRLGIYVRLPEQCANVGEPLKWQDDGTWVERWSAACPGGISGQRVEITGLSSTVIDALARVERLERYRVDAVDAAAVYVNASTRFADWPAKRVVRVYRRGSQVVQVSP